MTDATKALLERSIHLALSIVFMICLWIPLSQMEFKFVEIGKDAEKKELTAFPVFSIEYPIEFILSFEKYFNNNFGFRDQLIVMNNKMIIFTTGYAPQSKVILGQDGWLYFEEGLIDNWKRPAYTQEQLAEIKLKAEIQREILATNGTHFITVIAPDKHNIYPQYLRENILRSATNPRAAQQINYFKMSSNVPIVNIQPALLAASKKRPTYYKADTHWNGYGSFIGYQEVMKELKLKFPNLEILELEDFEITVVKNTKNNDMAKNLGMEGKFPDEEVTLTLKEEVKTKKLTPDKKLKKAVIYHDSFFDPGYSWNTIQYFRNHFDVVLDFSNRDAYDNEMLIKEKPDVVIYEIVERHL